MTAIEQITRDLAEPFDPGEVKFKPSVVSGNRALAIHFVDARTVQDRLDSVMGVVGWQDDYEVLADGSVVCRLRIRLGDEWVQKVDVGGPSEQKDEGDRMKAAFSDALKRAAVKFGIGRYLYRLPSQWCDYDPQKRQFVRPPILPNGAKPASAAARVAPAQPPVRKPNGKSPGVTLCERVKARDRALTDSSRIIKGDMLLTFNNYCEQNQYPADAKDWTAEQVQAAEAYLHDWEQVEGITPTT